MKRFLVMVLLVFVGTAGWRIGGRLSVDALGMAVGIVFGVLASIPAALLVLAASRGRRDGSREFRERHGQQDQYGGQPPVIVVAGPPGYPQQLPQQGPQYPALPGQGNIIDVPVERKFRVIGEEDEWTDEW